jgi:hypothetical protein
VRMPAIGRFSRTKKARRTAGFSVHRVAGLSPGAR